MKLLRDGIAFEADCVWYDEDTRKYVCGDESYDEVEVVVDSLPEDASISLDDYDVCDEHGDSLSADITVKCGGITIKAVATLWGHGYHYSGRNSYGEWVEPEESGFEITRTDIEAAYYTDDDIYDLDCVFGDDAIADIEREVQNALRN